MGWGGFVLELGQVCFGLRIIKRVEGGLVVWIGFWFIIITRVRLVKCN